MDKQEPIIALQKHETLKRSPLHESSTTKKTFIITLFSEFNKRKDRKLK